MDSTNHTVTEQIDVEQWLAIRKEAALKIDPETAEISRGYGPLDDPYRVCPDLNENYYGELFFARSPGSDVWVCFDDLPEETENALWQKYRLAYS